MRNRLLERRIHLARALNGALAPSTTKTILTPYDLAYYRLAVAPRVFKGSDYSKLFP